MRKAAAWLLLFTIFLAACSRSKAPPPAAGNPAGGAKPLPDGPDLTAVKGPYELSLEELEKGLLRYLSQGEGGVAERLNALYDRWGLRPQDDYPRLAERDLNGDGRAEVVTALNGAGGITGTGALFVIYQRDGELAIDRSGEGDRPGVGLVAVADLAGDHGLEIIWSSTQAGAHTTHTSALVSRWEPGHFRTLSDYMEISYAKLSLEGKDLLLSGGLIGSAGAGGAQRARTDRYRWVDNSFRLVDRVFVESPLAYHRLQDGIAAETFGRKDQAEQAFREAMAEDRALPQEGLVPPEKMGEFTQAVRSFARFRLGALLMQEGRPGEAQEALAGGSGPFAGLTEALAGAGERAAGCTDAEAWVRQNPAFLEALASPYGYANPAWQPEDLCGPLPPFGS